MENKNEEYLSFLTKKLERVERSLVDISCNRQLKSGTAEFWFEFNCTWPFEFPIPVDQVEQLVLSYADRLRKSIETVKVELNNE